FTAFATSMNEIYSLKARRADLDIDWAQTAADLTCESCLPGGTGSPTWVFSVEGLALVEAANVEIVEEDWETEAVRGKNIAVKLRKRRQTAYDALNPHGGTSLSTKPGRIATANQIQTDIDSLK